MKLSEYLVQKKITTKVNVLKMDFFDLNLEEDSAFYVDIFSLKKSEIVEFRNSFDDFLFYFRQVTGLIKFKKISEAEKKLMFKEINGFRLGYTPKNAKGSKSRGAGIGKELAKKISLSIQELIVAGEERPEIFSLLPFLVDNVGCDRISDLTLKILIKDFCTYTQNVFSQLDKERKLDYKEFQFEVYDVNVPKGTNQFSNRKYELPINPKDKSLPILLIPKIFLDELPVSYDYSDIFIISSFNSELRSKINNLLRPIIQMPGRKKAITKSELKEILLSNKKILKEIINDLEEKEPLAKILKSNVDKFVPNVDLSFVSTSIKPENIINIILDKFKHITEKNGGWKAFYHKGKPLPEKHCQMIFYYLAKAICDQNKTMVYPEANLGSGVVDFIIATDISTKHLIEIKLSNNVRLVHGFKEQLDSYIESDNPLSAYFLLIKISDENDGAMKSRLSKLEIEVNMNNTLNKYYFEVNAEKQKSASTKKPTSSKV